jgi:hypothetical protein
MFGPTGGRPVAQRPPDVAAELAIAALMGVVFGVGSLLWVAAEMAGRVTYGRWPHLGLATAAVAAIRLPGHLGQPRTAWPSEVRAQFGSATVFWASVVAEIALLATSAIVAGRVVHAYHSNVRRRARRPGMASAAELRRELSVTARRRRAGIVRPSLDVRANREGRR